MKLNEIFPTFSRHLHAAVYYRRDKKGHFCTRPPYTHSKETGHFFGVSDRTKIIFLYVIVVSFFWSMCDRSYLFEFSFIFGNSRKSNLCKCYIRSPDFMFFFLILSFFFSLYVYLYYFKNFLRFCHLFPSSLRWAVIDHNKLQTNKFSLMFKLSVSMLSIIIFIMLVEGVYKKHVNINKR